MLNMQEEIITTKAEISDNISALPAGIVKHPKPLSNHHYILTSVDNIAPAIEILWRISQNRIATRKDPNKPFVIASFDEHQTISHILARACLLARFAHHQKEEPEDKSRKFIYAEEHPYNYLYYYVKQAYKKELPDEYKYSLNKIDPDNHILMKAITAKNIFRVAPQTRNILFRTCLQHGIKTYFNDAARIINERYLDLNDPNIDLPHKYIDCREREGMSIRNEFMAKYALERAEEQEASIIIQGTGIAHGGIKESKDYPYEESYLIKCRDLGAEVTSIFCSTTRTKAERAIPEQALKDDPNMIIIDGMPKYLDLLDRRLTSYIKLKYLSYSYNAPYPITPTYPATTKSQAMKLLNNIR